MSLKQDTTIYGEVSRILPQGKVDNVDSGAARFARYDELFVQNIHPDFGTISEEGTYFTVNNAQTGLATAAAPVAFSATNPFLLIYNSDSTNNPLSKHIILDYALLLATVAGTAGTSVQFAIVLDNINRYTSGGTNLTSLIVNPNSDGSGKPIAQVIAGNIVATAASLSARTVVGNRFMKGAIPVAGDQYTIKFGGVDAPSFIGSSTILTSLNNVPKIVIAPGWCALIYIWLPAQSAASSYAPEIGWVER